MAPYGGGFLVTCITDDAERHPRYTDPETAEDIIAP
jgi:hypothetical protein